LAGDPHQGVPQKIASEFSELHISEAQPDRYHTKGIDLENINLILNILLLASVGLMGLLWKKTLSKYLTEKGKNLATKEDIGEITNKVEEVKSNYLIELEKIKMDLSFLSKKHTILFDEKIIVFKKLQKRLVDFKKYCTAMIGEVGEVSEFHPNLLVLSKDIDKAALQHITALYEIKQEDFIFLSEKSKELLSTLLNSLSMMPSMEIHLSNGDDDLEMQKNFTEVYENTIEKIDKCLIGLFNELEFSSQNDNKT